MRVQIVWAASSELSGHPSRGQSKGLYEWGNVNMETEREHVTGPVFVFVFCEERFRVVWGLLSDSRPFCAHLTGKVLSVHAGERTEPDRSRRTREKVTTLLFFCFYANLGECKKDSGKTPAVDSWRFELAPFVRPLYTFWLPLRIVQRTGPINIRGEK